MAQNHASDPERIRQMLQALRASLGQAEEQESSVPDHNPIAVLNTEERENPSMIIFLAKKITLKK